MTDPTDVDAAKYDGVTGEPAASAAGSDGGGADHRRSGGRNWASTAGVVGAAVVVIAVLIAILVSTGGDEEEGGATTSGASTAAATPSTGGATTTLASTTTLPPTTTTTPATSTTAPRESTSVSVPGDVRWSDTGVDVAAGDELEFAATGEVAHGAPDPTSFVGPEGDERAVLQQFNRVEGGATVDGPHAALIGRIGDGAPFVIGASSTITATSPGRVVLGVNDDGVDNNEGSFTVTISVVPGG